MKIFKTLSCFYAFILLIEYKKRGKMQNKECKTCGGCPLRNLELNDYRSQKIDEFKKVLSSIKEKDFLIDEPIFIEDGLRRRAEMAFCYENKELKLGFNEAQSSNIVDLTKCMMLDASLNKLLPILHNFLEDIISIPVIISTKKKRVERVFIKKGSVRLLKADNGIDILLIIDNAPNVEHRMLIAEFVNSNQDVLRVSWQEKNKKPEEIVTKSVPMLNIKGYEIAIPQGAFLQASKDAEDKMIDKVMEYLDNTSGKIMDLFCGLGTFTYPLSLNKNNEIISVDSSDVSLKGLEKALAVNQIHNVKVINKNLFKYPLEKDDFNNIKAIVIDPPRAGAHEQCREILKLNNEQKPQKIVFVSCNPKTFVYDANVLIEANYNFERVTLVDQFVYSNHMELIALFTLNQDK